MARNWKNLNITQKIARIWHHLLNYRYWRITRALSFAAYWLRCHTYNKYHILDLRPSDPDGYRYGYLDRDNAMFLAMFKCLTDFVELELMSKQGKIMVYITLENIANENDAWRKRSLQNQYDEQSKVLGLYHWFKNDYPALNKTSFACNKLYDLETAKMRELLDIRSSLWT